MFKYIQSCLSNGVGLGRQLVNIPLPYGVNLQSTFTQFLPFRDQFAVNLKCQITQCYERTRTLHFHSSFSRFTDFKSRVGAIEFAHDPARAATRRESIPTSLGPNRSSQLGQGEHNHGAGAATRRAKGGTRRADWNTQREGCPTHTPACPINRNHTRTATTQAVPHMQTVSGQLDYGDANCL